MHNILLRSNTAMGVEYYGSNVGGEPWAFSVNL